MNSHREQVEGGTSHNTTAQLRTDCYHCNAKSLYLHIMYTGSLNYGIIFIRCDCDTQQCENGGDDWLVLGLLNAQSINKKAQEIAYTVKIVTVVISCLGRRRNTE